MKRTFGLALLVAAAACSRNKDKSLPVAVASVQRRDIVIDAQANGTIEPINIIEVKSKASGVITKVPVETGTIVKPGDLLVQVDTRDVNNQLEQAKADLEAAQEKYDVSALQKKRSDDMFSAKVITAQEHETSALDLRNANTALIRAKAALDLAQQRVEDATVEAPSAGTIIDKTVAVGTVIASATGSVSGGATLLKMADLSRVRIRAFFNESDIGMVRGGQVASVAVDAYSNRPFVGVVEKIEPQAVVQQNVTMFPVLVTLDNQEGLLKPGMNGEVTVTVNELDNALAVPNDAVRNIREAAAIATMLNLNTDSVAAEIKAQQGNRGGGMGGGRAGGDVSLIGDMQQQDQQAGNGRRGGNMPQVTAEECKQLDATIAKKPAEKKKLDDLRAKMQEPGADRRAINQEMQPIYATIGVDARKVGACRFLNGGGRGGRNGNNGGGTGAGSFQRNVTANTQANAAGKGQGALTPSGEFGGQQRRPKSGLVFVSTDSANKHFEPRVLQLGQGNFDYTEVLSGLKEGDKVVLVSALQLQANRQAQNDRTKAQMGVPGLNPNAGPGGAGGPGRGPGGGGAPAGGGGGGGGARGGRG